MNTKIEALLSKEYACTSEELNGDFFLKRKFYRCGG